LIEAMGAIVVGCDGQFLGWLKEDPGAPEIEIRRVHFRRQPLDGMAKYQEVRVAVLPDDVLQPFHGGRA
jgi:hypothetical protein